MKKIYRVLLPAAGLLLADGLTRLRQHRSLAAAAIEKALPLYTKPHTPAAEELREKLEAQRTQPPEAYTVPPVLRFSKGLERRDYRLGEDSMPCYYINEGSPSGLTVLFLHGGSYVEEFTPFHWQWAEKLARELDAEVLCPDYPMAPQSTFERAYRLVTGLFRDYRAAHPDRRLVLMGDSAGGGLVLGLCQALRDGGLPLPETAVLLSPWPDLTMSNPQIDALEALDPMLHRESLVICGEFWAGDANPRDPRLSPLFGRMEGLCPMLLTTGTHELFYPDILLLHQKMLDAGVETKLVTGEGLNHVYPFFPIPEAGAAFREIADWIGAPHTEQTI